ncbi:hypothetical protein KSP39_PZI003224 [Platanthera zijinensis]|uniref:Uncharacterized protein n=1 Tax=Platanthera zijinensis TaxID=2320716 RepID=A0AAP0BU90_9ASPA
MWYSSEASAANKKEVIWRINRWYVYELITSVVEGAGEGWVALRLAGGWLRPGIELASGGVSGREARELLWTGRGCTGFARLYPLDQKDLVPAIRPIDFGIRIPSGVEVERNARDYTPPQYLTLLFSDLGVLTPSVVSDELIQLYL